MNASAAAKRGYADQMMPTRSDRRTEYEVFAQVTQRLRATAMQAKTNYPKYVEALHDNQKLWRILAIDVADENNSLPADLRARIFYLSEFTEAHTRKILNENASIMPLLEINVAVMRGLKKEGSA